jgi:hypothetical protein
MGLPDEDKLEDVEAKLDKLTPWEIEAIARKRAEKFCEEAKQYLNYTDSYKNWEHKTSDIIQAEILLELRKLRKLLGDGNE